jgi:hypothetical protein
MPVLKHLSPFEYIDYCRVGASVQWHRLVRACAHAFANVEVSEDESIIAIGGGTEGGAPPRIRITHLGGGVFTIVGNHGREALLRHYEALAMLELFTVASETVWYFDEYELL